MAALLSLVPQTARLVPDGTSGTIDVPATVQVPTDSLAVGDVVLVLPGVWAFFFKSIFVNFVNFFFSLIFLPKRMWSQWTEKYNGESQLWMRALSLENLYLFSRKRG